MREFLSASEVAKRYGVSVSTVWNWLQQGNLPEPYRFSKSCTRWKIEDLIEHERKLARSGGGEKDGLMGLVLASPASLMRLFQH